MLNAHDIIHIYSAHIHTCGHGHNANATAWLRPNQLLSRHFGHFFLMSHCKRICAQVAAIHW